MNIAKYLLVVVDYNKEGIEIYYLYSLDELEDFELDQEERKELIYSSKTKSNGRMFKIISVRIDVSRKGNEQTT